MIAAARLHPVPEASVSDAPDSFEAVYREHADALYRFCLSQLGEPAQAEDAAAEAFSSALASWARVQPDAGGVRPWLFRIARNACIDEMRRSRRRALLHLRIRRSAVAGGDVETEAELRAEVRRAVAALRRLDRRSRQLVGLRVAGGLSHAEIAAIAGMSEAAVRQSIHRSLQRLRRGAEETP
jgi:RNA polymerase sigma-70 factor (ECF subfamily)